MSTRRPRQKMNVGAIKKKMFSATGLKARTAWSTLFKLNWADNSSSKLCTGQATKTQKTMYTASNSEIILRRKPNRWSLVYLTWNIVKNKDYNSDIYSVGQIHLHNEIKWYFMIQQFQMKEYIQKNLVSKLWHQTLDQRKNWLVKTAKEKGVHGLK